MGQSVLVGPGSLAQLYLLAEPCLLDWHSCISWLNYVSWPTPAFWLPQAGSDGAQCA